MLLRRGVPIEAKPFQLGVRIEQPQAPIDRARYGASAGHPALGAADYSASVRAGEPRPVHVLHVRRRLRHAQRERARLLLHQRHEREPPRLAVRQQRPGRHDRARRDRQHAIPLAGVHYQQRVERLAYLAGGPIVRGAAPVGPRLPRRPAEPRHAPDQLSPRRHGAIDLGLFLPEPVVEALVHGLPLMDRRFGGQFLRDATLTGPESRGSSPVRILRDPQTRAEPRPSPASTPAAKGPATPAGSSARPSTACARPGPSSRVMQTRCKARNSSERASAR